jgi:RimJ/RimL family protein N-acetyltransferase
MDLGEAPETIRTPRLTLRALRRDDGLAIVQGVGNYDVSRWLSVVPYPYGLSDAESFIEAALTEAKPVWAICDGTGLIGCCGTQNGYGFWLARPAWGKGYATEAGDAVIDHIFSDPTKDALKTRVFDGNQRSRRVLDKLGFVETGRDKVAARALSQTVNATKLEISRARWSERRNFKIVTERLEITHVQKSDWPDMQRLGGVSEVAAMISSISIPWSDADVRAWIASATFRGRPGFRCTIRLKSGETIGSLGFGRSAADENLSCYYWLGRKFWGQGFATEAMRGFLSECYARFPGLDEIEADHFHGNRSSGRVLEKLGFVRIGESIGHSKARLEPAPVVVYRVSRQTFGAKP